MKSNDIRIVVLQRGWVVVGRYSKKGMECRIEGGAVVRRWGTNKGLGQLASEGPRTETVLDPCPPVTYHEMTAVLSMACNADAWGDHVRSA